MQKPELPISRATSNNHFTDTYCFLSQSISNSPSSESREQPLIMNRHHPPATNGSHPLVKSPQPLKVVVVGAGIGGLFAAIALRAAGHHVEIYESSRFAVETGAAIHIPPNVNGLLRRYGLIPEDYGAVNCEYISEEFPNGDLKFRRDVRGLGHAFAYPWQLIHRIELHNALKNIARDAKREGKPVLIHLQSKVTSVDVEKTSITLQDGKVVYGDLVLGADGVHVSSPLGKSMTRQLTEAVCRS